MKFATAGTLESNDCLITVYESTKNEIKIDSIVFKQFGQEIYDVISNYLKENNIKNLLVDIKDKGALNYTIIARLETAIKRLEAK